MNIAVNATNLSNKDQQAALWMIQQENARITAENTRKAALFPPQTASPLMPLATNAEIKTSYESLLAQMILGAHASYTQQEAEANGPNRADFKAAFANATPAQRTAALSALTA